MLLPSPAEAGHIYFSVLVAARVNAVWGLNQHTLTHLLQKQIFQLRSKADYFGKLEIVKAVYIKLYY